MMNRRTALSMLGLASATVAIAGEDIAKPLQGSFSCRFGINKLFSEVLRRMADDIDAGGTLVQSGGLNSETSHEEFLLHTLTIKFALMDKPPQG